MSDMQRQSDHPQPSAATRAAIEQAASASLSPGLFLTSVYRCDDPAQAAQRLAGELDGYVYQRDRHPNGDWLADLVKQWHRADWAVITSSGMAAMSAAVLASLTHGQHLIVSSQLYGKSTHLLTHHAARCGISATLVDTFDLAAVRAAMRPETRLIVVETLTNPVLRVAPLEELAEIAHQGGAELLVDNTFASPVLCRPLEWGADWVLESLSKVMNGHSDVMLGALCGRGSRLPMMRDVVSSWGLASSPFDCWLAQRGMQTLRLRVERACQNARRVAEDLQTDPRVREVIYPGLPNHPDRCRAEHLFDRSSQGELMAGTMVCFQLAAAVSADRVIRASRDIPFCPSLGEVSTTLSHPASTSHRALSPGERATLGISDGTIRLSVGTENTQWIRDAIRAALAAT